MYNVKEPVGLQLTINVIFTVATHLLATLEYRDQHTIHTYLYHHHYHLLFPLIYRTQFNI